MKFSEWWDANRAKYHWSLRQHYQEVWEAGVTEGLRRAQVARSDTTQGGGSQKCYLCGSEGFEKSKHLAYGCTFCDGTEGGQQPGA
jgi:hypothetical protein